MYYDDTNCWGRHRSSEAQITEYYLAHHPEIRRMISETSEEVEWLLMNYGEFLTGEQKLQARLLNTRICEPKYYRDLFMPNVLYASYNVWDASHEKYPRILKAIAQHNPEYLRNCMADHERKLRVCKVQVYKIKK